MPQKYYVREDWIAESVRYFCGYLNVAGDWIVSYEIKDALPVIRHKAESIARQRRNLGGERAVDIIEVESRATQAGKRLVALTAEITRLTGELAAAKERAEKAEKQVTTADEFHRNWVSIEAYEILSRRCSESRAVIFEKQAADFGHQNVTLMARNESLISELTTLHTTVGRLRGALENCIDTAKSYRSDILGLHTNSDPSEPYYELRHMPNRCDRDAVIREAESALSATGPDNLASVKAGALREMASQCKTVFGGDLPHVTENELLEEADRLEAAAKEPQNETR